MLGIRLSARFAGAQIRLVDPVGPAGGCGGPRRDVLGRPMTPPIRSRPEATTAASGGAQSHSDPVPARSRCLHYLPDAGVVAPNANTALIGHDAWADGRLGDYAGSDVMLNDCLLIEELAGHDAQARLARLKALGDEAAVHVRRCLPAALQRYRRIIVATHVPRFVRPAGTMVDDDKYLAALASIIDPCPELDPSAGFQSSLELGSALDGAAAALT